MSEKRFVDEELTVSLMSASGLLRSANDHLTAVEELVRSGDFAGALTQVRSGATQRSLDALVHLAAVSERLSELGGESGLSQAE